MKIALPAKDLPQRLPHSFKSVPNECNEWG